MTFSELVRRLEDAKFPIVREKGSLDIMRKPDALGLFESTIMVVRKSRREPAMRFSKRRFEDLIL
jgi:predicted RNA binding protein YcfA (HicA-like mRNA interferase family)